MGIAFATAGQRWRRVMSGVEGRPADGVGIQRILSLLFIYLNCITVIYLSVYVFIYLLCMKTAGCRRWRVISDRSLSRWHQCWVNFCNCDFLSIYLFMYLFIMCKNCRSCDSSVTESYTGLSANGVGIQWILSLLYIYLLNYYVCKLHVSGGRELYLAGSISIEWVLLLYYLLVIYLFIYYVWKLQVTGGGGLCLAGLPAGGVSAEWVSHQVGA